MKKSFLLLVITSTAFSAQNFSKQDTLKGSNTAFRDFWDVKKYEISVEPNIQNKSVAGTNKITFEITKDVTNPVFQIDLQQPMKY
ncbi:MAG: M1 family peptidase, partial [Kaistella sp.]